MTRPARWKVLAFAAALTGLGMAGAATANAESSSTGLNTSAWDYWLQTTGAATANAESGSTGDESGVAAVPSDTSWYVGLSESLPPV
jgi:hypothetical protein